MAKEFKKVIKLPVWSRSVEIVFTEDIFNSRNIRDKQVGCKYEGSSHLAGLTTWNDDKCKTWVFLNMNSSEGTIAHECFHIVHRMMKFHWAKVENEVYAYYIGYLVDEIIKFRKKINEKNNTLNIPDPSRPIGILSKD